MTGKTLTPTPDRTGHAYVSLSQSSGPRRRRYTHGLVLETFVGPRPVGQECLHDDGDPLNNHLSNLRWGTHAENMADRVRHGRHSLKNRSHCPRGHLLLAPNLVPGKVDIGWRECLACSKAFKARYKARRAGRSFDLQAEADRLYKLIMGADAS
jgi:hypothetical protein